MLEWETAAEAELEAGKRTFVDLLLNWTPVVALVVGVIVYASHRHALYDALPDPAFVGVQQAGILLAQSAAAARAQGNHRAGQALPPPVGTAHLALLRDVQQRRAQLADS